VSQGGSWASEYGDFFLDWYSGLLVQHCDRVLGAAAQMLNRKGRPRVFMAYQEVGGGCRGRGLPGPGRWG
jgi:beta-amylase